MAEFVRVAGRSEVPENGAKAVEARGRRIALFNAGGVFYAIDNACRHMGVPLSAGKICGTHVICPWHGWKYDFTTGAMVDDDDPEIRVACFKVKLEGDDVFIEI
jgi:nitrite reductase/ring-hydroxylating ferredoxin subunit